MPLANYVLSVFVPGYGAIGYDELTARGTLSPRYTFTHGGSRATRTFLCDWRDRDAFVKGVVGFPRIRNTAAAKPYDTYVSRVLPMALPDSLTPDGEDQGEEWLYATGVVEQVGVGPTGLYDDDGVAQYQQAKTTVQYEGLTYKVIDDAALLNLNTGPGLPGVPDEAIFGRYITRTQRPTAEFVTIPRGIMKWFDDGVGGHNSLFEAASARLLPSTEIVYVWHQVPFVPQAVETHVGKLNSDTFTDSAKSYLPGTLLCLAAEVKPYRHASGQFVNDITYRIKYFEPDPGRGHNFFFRQRAWAATDFGKLCRVKITSTGDNDSVAIPGDGDAGSPYNVTKAAGTARGLYDYVLFSDLFHFKWQ